MNKARRHELKMLHYNRRVKRVAAKSRSIKEYLRGNNNFCKLYAYRSHGKPCSCIMCSPYKYNRAKEKSKYQKELSRTFIEPKSNCDG